MTPAPFVAPQDMKNAVSGQTTHSVLMESSPYIIIITNNEGRIIDVNQAALHTYGFSRDELLQMRIADLNADSNTSEVYSSAIFASPVLKNKTMHKSKEGIRFSVEVDTRNVLLGEETVSINMIYPGSTVDQIPDYLYREKGEFRNVLEHAPYGVMVIDATGTKLLYVNQHMIKLTGYSREELMNIAISHIDEIFPDPEDQWQWKTQWRSNAGSEDPLVLKIRRKDGICRYLSYRCSSFLSGHIIALMVDVTDSTAAREELRISEAKYRAAVQNSHDMIVIYEPDSGRLRYVNPEVCNVIGYTEEEILGTILWDYYHPEDVPVILAKSRERIVGSANVERYVARAITKSGKQRYLEIVGSVLDLDGPAVLISAHDITERVEMEQSLRESERRLRYLFENMLDGFTSYRLLVDEEGQAVDYEYLEANESYLNLIGHGGENIIGKRVTVVLPRIKEDSIDWISLGARVVQQGERAKFEAYSEALHKWLSVSAFSTASGYFAVTMSDITERKEAEANRQYLSTHDGLTGLYNRSYFESALQMLDTAKNYPLSIIIGDMNGLKLANDAFGHNKGDYLLQTMADILLQACREDDIVCRWGGDEFAIILPATDTELTANCCQEIKKLCDITECGPIKPSIALGFAAKRQRETSLDTLIKTAEDNMYRNKLLQSKSVRYEMLSALETTLYERTQETQEHAERLAYYCSYFGQSLKLSEADKDRLLILARLHDIGKVGIPDYILNKPGPLDDNEWDIIKKHPEIGFRIAQTSSELSAVADEILAHHEHWDGRGYPRGLRRDEIPLLAQIISIVDAYDVMTHARSYKEPLTNWQAILELKRCAGTQFNPALVKQFVEFVSS